MYCFFLHKIPQIAQIVSKIPLYQRLINHSQKAEFQISPSVRYSAAGPLGEPFEIPARLFFRDMRSPTPYKMHMFR